MIDGFITSVIHRPYVFAFLGAYLFLAWRRWGWPRTIIWLVSGYFIAWLSEVSSIHNGFPYGEYHYIYENLHGELLVAGVPFFDSLSYPFLIFAGFTMAEFILTAPERLGTCAPAIPGTQAPRCVGAIFLGALLTMLLDVIIDPIATMGDKWFLGKIHYYAHPGRYFGVPLTNFAGWFLVAFAVIAINTLLWRVLPRIRNLAISRSCLPAKPARQAGDLAALFYTSIALFNIAVTFWVGELKLGIASSMVLAIPFLLVSLLRRKIFV